MMTQPLRNRITEMAVGQVITVDLNRYKSNTVYYYASFIGRELGRTYSTRYLRDARAIEVKRTA